MEHPRRTPDIRPLLAVLEKHQVQYVLVGSVAALLYGIEVEAGDLDITPALDRENLGRLAAVLVEIEARIDPDEAPGHWAIQPNGERQWVVDALTPDVAAARAAWVPDPDDPASMDSLFLTRYGNFDVVPDLSGTYEDLIPRAERMSAYGHELWVAHIDDLLAALTVPRRKKDASRVRQLRAIQRLRN